MTIFTGGIGLIAVMIMTIMPFPYVYGINGTIPVSIDKVSNDHGFYTTQDPIVLTVTVTNNQNENITFVASGIQRSLNQVVFNPDIEPAYFTLAPGKNYSFSRLMDNRWEGPFSAEIDVEGQAFPSKNNYTGSAVVRYTVEPYSNVFEKQNADYNKYIAIASVVGVVTSPVIALIAMKRQSSDTKTSLKRSEEQHKQTMAAMQDELKIARDQLAQSKQEKKDERYYQHSKTIAKAMENCWVKNREGASASFTNGIFQRKEVSPPKGNYLSQTRNHLEEGYPQVLEIYNNGLDKITEVFNKMEKKTEEFRKKIPEELDREWPDLDLRETDAGLERMEGQFIFALEGKLLEALFIEMVGRTTREHVIEFHVSGPAGIGPTEENGRRTSLTYHIIEIQGWHLRVAYGTDRPQLKTLCDFLNNLMLKATIRNITDDYGALESELKVIQNMYFSNFDAEISTILDAAMDDNFILGRGSCNLCHHLN